MFFDLCLDFYFYFCVFWMKENLIFFVRNMYDIFFELDDENFKRLCDVLEEMDEFFEYSVVKKIKSYFEFCLKEEEVEKDINVILIFVMVKYGFWVLDNEMWNVIYWEWFEILFFMIRDFIGMLFLEVEININL